MTISPAPDLLTVQQASLACGKSPGQIARAIETGKLSAGQGRRGWVVGRGELMRWMAGGRNPQMVATDLLLVHEAAELTGVCEATVYYALRQGQLPRAEAGGHIAIPREALLAWNSNRVQRRDRGLTLDPERITMQQAARELEVSPGVLAYAVKRGRLRAEKLRGGVGYLIVLWRAEVTQWLHERADLDERS